MDVLVSRPRGLGLPDFPLHFQDAREDWGVLLPLF